MRKRVKDGGDWDLKTNGQTIYGKDKTNSTVFVFNGIKMEAQDVGNHHFGVVSKANIFIGEDFALRQAGKNQIKKGLSMPEWQIKEAVSYPFVSPSGVTTSITIEALAPPYGDDPRDQKWIKEGFKYNKR